MRLKAYFKNLYMMTREMSFRFRKESYFCSEPKITKGYIAKQIGPYFYDFSAKTHWKGLVDNSGIPVINTDNEYFPVTIIQKALGHHILFLKTKHKQEKKKFLECCRWILNNTDRDGGILTWRKTQGSRNNRYSAITQGMATSVLVRAYLLTKQKEYLEKAYLLIGFMLEGNNNSLITQRKSLTILDEYPGSRYQFVLNGWIFALFGLYELYLTEKDKDLLVKLQKLLLSLASGLKYYDAGFWSYYDQAQHISSVYYHKSHIILLEVLSINFPKYSEFISYRNIFIKYLNNPFFKILSQTIKFFQKIVNPTQSIY